MTPSNDVATRNRVVVDPNTGTNRQIIAGQAIPPDLVDAVEGPSVVEAGYEGSGRDDAGAGAATVAPDLAGASDDEIDAYVKHANSDEVVALAGEDKDAAQRVLDSENRGKARKGVIEALEAIVADD
jgi:hypothetical protein